MSSHTYFIVWTVVGYLIAVGSMLWLAAGMLIELLFAKSNSQPLGDSEHIVSCLVGLALGITIIAVTSLKRSRSRRESSLSAAARVA